MFPQSTLLANEEQLLICRDGESPGPLAKSFQGTCGGRGETEGSHAGALTTSG